MNVTEVDMNAEKKISFQLPIYILVKNHLAKPTKNLPIFHMIVAFMVTTSFLDSRDASRKK